MSKEKPPTEPDKVRDVREPGANAGGCSIGCSFLFLLAGIAWPLLHILGRTYEPETLVVPLLIGGPAFIGAHILAFMGKGHPTRRTSMLLLWGGVILALLFVLGAALVDYLRAN